MIPNLQPHKERKKKEVKTIYRKTSTHKLALVIFNVKTITLKDRKPDVWVSTFRHKAFHIVDVYISPVCYTVSF